jgi:hypothetical protein
MYLSSSMCGSMMVSIGCIIEKPQNNQFKEKTSNISAFSWRPVLVVEEAGENHQPWASNW